MESHVRPTEEDDEHVVVRMSRDDYLKLTTRGLGIVGVLHMYKQPEKLGEWDVYSILIESYEAA